MGQLGAVNFLIENGADPRLRDSEGQKTTALHEAARGGWPHVIASLARAGGDPAVVDEHGDTPLHIACRLGWRNAAAALLKADDATLGTLIAKNDRGQRPVDLAAACKRHHERGDICLLVDDFLEKQEARDLIRDAEKRAEDFRASNFSPPTNESCVASSSSAPDLILTHCSTVPSRQATRRTARNASAP